MPLIDKANAVADGLVANHGKDAAVVKAIPFIQIIQQLLAALMQQLGGCITPPTPAPTPTPPPAADAVMNHLHNPTWADEIYLHRETRNALGTLRAYREIGTQLQTEVKRVAAATTADETPALMAEAQSM